MMRACPVCDYDFKDGDKLVAIMLSTFKEIESDVHFAITEPRVCVEIVHRECYNFADGQVPEEPPYMGGDLLS